MIDLANNGQQPVDYAELLASIQYRLARRTGRRTPVGVLGAYLGYKSASAVSPWLTGKHAPTRGRPQFRIRLLSDALDGKIEFPPGINESDPDAATMEAWHERAWAAHVAHESKIDRRVENAASAFSPRHIIKSLDQNGESLDRIERKLDALGEAVNGLLREWQTTRPEK